MCDVTISVYEFMQKFPDQDVAREYIEGRRWKNGIKCAFCQSSRVTRQKNKQYIRCKDCRQIFTVRTGTIFERSHIPLQKWLYTMYLLTTSRKGISSLQLSKELGITQKSAWFLLHRIREACGNSDKKLCGEVEIDETYIGGKESNKHNSKKLKAGRGAVGKQAVVGLRERKGKVKAIPIESTDKETLHAIVRDNVRPGSTIYTDDNPSYTGALRRHKTVNHSAREYVSGMAHTNGIESVWAVLKRGYNGTYHNWSMKHCQRYVDEFAFRLNDGNVEVHVLDRIRSLCDKVNQGRITYKQLIS